MENLKEKIVELLKTTPKHVAGNRQWLEIHHPILYSILKNKFDTFETDSLSETYYRILNNIIEKPKCPICGNSVKFKKDGINKYRQFCSLKCMNSNKGQEIMHAKCKQTYYEKTGYENPFANPEVKEKLKYIWQEKYGVENPFASDKIKEKIVNTWKTNYNVDNPKKSKYIIEKIKKTNLEKYGNTMYLQSDEGLKKSKYVLKQRYGNEIFAHTETYKNKIKDIQQKRINSLKRNKSFNTSKIEQQFKEYLEQNYPNDFEYQYKSELYPFNCDFYIKSLDLYIEIQGNWTHGGHPFDENNKDDLKRLEYMKSKNSGYYQNAINVWILSDVKKRNIAKENNLNYLEIFSININECINALNKYIENEIDD